MNKDRKALKVDYSEIDRMIGSRLKEIRKLNGYTQKQMANLLKLSAQQAYSRYELGRSSIPASTLFRLSETLKVNIEHLFPITGSVNLEDSE